jgi:histidinol-phosphate aminotransferase
VFAIWKGKLPREIFEIGQQGYAAAEPVVYPEGVEVIDCGLGTNPLGMPESLSRFLEGAGGCNLCDYPAPEPEDLKAAIAVAHGSWGISPEQVLVGGGSMGVLVTLVRLLLRPGSVISGVSPQFTDTVLQALYNGASYDPAPLEAPHYTIETARLLETLGKKPEVLYLDRPHNPTGQVLPLDDVALLARSGIETGTWVISDEAYGDFLPDDESAAILDFPNLVTCRSFSKGPGAAGIRAGFAVIRDPELAILFRKVQPPFVIGALDVCLALEILKEPAFLAETRAYVQMAKTRVLDVVRHKRGWFAADTDGRVPIFLLFQESGNLVHRLAAVGISCEGGSGYFGMDDRSARLRVPAPAKLEAFLDRIARA